MHRYAMQNICLLFFATNTKSRSLVESLRVSQVTRVCAGVWSVWMNGVRCKFVRIDSVRFVRIDDIRSVRINGVRFEIHQVRGLSRLTV